MNFRPLANVLVALLPAASARTAAIPLSEHPRPDFERADWVNLNGPWSFRFDPGNVGESEGWFRRGIEAFDQTILVPFPWGSELSGLPDTADVGWYARRISVPEGWKEKRVFLVVGACDWTTTAWLDGHAIGSHRGGYTPFELELTPVAEAGKDHLLVLRADDTPHPFKLEGKQGYGPARGIWQTVYLEARPSLHIRSIHFVPDLDRRSAVARLEVSGPASRDVPVRLRFLSGGLPDATETLKADEASLAATMAVPEPRAWSPDDPFLYEVEVTLDPLGPAPDRVRTYFGMRKISVERVPGLGHPWIALNGKPLYLRMTLDQAYCPDGYYTFPSDDFMREEILRSRRIGLNANRVHVKIEVPRKLYWADRLGLLIMADVPNSWGEPDADMRAETETALRGMIHRDFNHPSIFSWVLFNETWGLRTKGKGYTPETQAWVESMYRLARSLDPTRLVEDNSPCNLDHVVTDINSWHSYLPGYRWREHLDQVTREAFPGSTWNFVSGRVQAEQPLLNSECGNVWGYEGSTGDVDWSWDYHIMMNEFRRHPKICGWLYTEHHDVINEWNGYYRYDRSGKITGLSDLMPGMTLRDLHGPFYVVPDVELCLGVKPGEKVRVPLWASFLTDEVPGGELTLRTELCGWDFLGRARTWATSEERLPSAPWTSRELPALEVEMPSVRAVAILRLWLEDASGSVLHRNFTTFDVGEGTSPRGEMASVDGRKARILRASPGAFSAANWTLGHRLVLDGLKACGTGAGFFEYRLPWPAGLGADAVASGSFIAELGAKVLHGKDKTDAQKQEGDFMRGKGTHDPSLNPNAYPMTDTSKSPSAVRISVAGIPVGLQDLEDDPADHRGILSWRSQKRDGRLREAGSHGYLVSIPLPKAALAAAKAAGEIVVRLEVDASLPGGLAVYGERFGRYPLDPSVVLVLRE